MFWTSFEIYIKIEFGPSEVVSQHTFLEIISEIVNTNIIQDVINIK